MLKTKLLYYPGSFPPGEFLDRFFRHSYDFCVRNGYTFIAYTHPGEEGAVGEERKKTSRSTRVLISRGLQQKPLLDIREFSPTYPGFLFSPFDHHPEQPHPRFSFFNVEVIIPVDGWRKEKGGYRGRIRYRGSEEAGEIMVRFKGYLDRIDRKRIRPVGEMYVSEEENGENRFSTPKKIFCRSIADAVSQIRSPQGKSGLKKVVLSKLKIVSPPLGFDLISFYLRLLRDFPFSFVNLVSGPEVGTWMGASPEILVKRDSRKIFQTVSLAGTQWHDMKHGSPPVLLHQVGWTQKEIEEQAVTSRFIINSFKKIRLREYVEEGPATVRKGNLLHLQSTYRVDLNRYYGDSLPFEMISLLHPTPAVCGDPPMEALREIRRIEVHDRRYYAGYLGPVEIDGSIDVYVNLRCLQWLRVQGRLRCGLYAGVGVNRFSVPEKEWQETEAKLSWLIRGIRASGKKIVKEDL